MGGGREIEGLSLIRLPYRRVQPAGSAAVSKLKLTGSAGAARSNGRAGLGLTVIRRLDFASLAPAKKSPDLLKGSAQVPSNKIHIKHLLMWFSSPWKRRRRISMAMAVTFFGSPYRDNAFARGGGEKREWLPGYSSDKFLKNHPDIHWLMASLKFIDFSIFKTTLRHLWMKDWTRIEDIWHIWLC